MAAILRELFLITASMGCPVHDYLGGMDYIYYVFIFLVISAVLLCYIYDCNRSLCCLSALQSGVAMHLYLNSVVVSVMFF